MLRPLQPDHAGRRTRLRLPGLNSWQLGLLFLLMGSPGIAQQAGTIGSSTATTVSRQLVTTDSTTTTNNLSQSLIINASGVNTTPPNTNLVQTSIQSYQLATPNGSVATQLRTTELNPAVSFIPASQGAEMQLSITNELPGIKSFTTSTTTSDTQSTTNSFSVYTAPLSQ
jgi:hypothetical protein